MALRMRRYTQEDREACLALFDSNVPEFFVPAEREGFDAFLVDMPVTYFVLENENEIVACGGVATREGEARMCWGIVGRAHHGEKIGTWLLLERLVAGVELGATRAGLDTIPKTVPFFERFGFRVVREVENGYGPGIHRRDMQLDFDPVSVAKLREQLASVRTSR